MKSNFQMFGLLAFLFVGFVGPANADTSRIGKVSRACRLDALPQFFLVGGFIPMERSSIPTREAGGLYEGLSDLDKKNFWALESFTTYYIPLLEFPDARRAQYHLRVNAIAWYRYDQWQRNVFAPFFQFNQYDSGWQSKWTQSEVRPLPFAFIFFRARAGTGVWPYFFLRPFPGGEFSYGTGYPNVVFWVRGEHFYKDGNSTNPLPVPFGYSRAYNDCNLSQWGWFWETP